MGRFFGRGRDRVDARDTVRRGLAAVGAATLAAVPLSAAGLLVASPASAASGAVGISHTDGTAPFAAGGSGYDESGTNDVVRTNDFMTYHVSISADAATMAAPTITLTLPQGVELMNPDGSTGAPAFCATSTVTPASITDAVPVLTSNTPSQNDGAVTALSGTSWTSLPSQTVVCQVADIPVGAAEVFDFTARVRSEVPHGTVLAPATVKVSDPGDQGGGNDLVPATPDTPVTVSAASKWDLSINGAQAIDDPNSAFVKQGTVERCVSPSIPRIDPQGDGTTEPQWCFVGGYPVTLSIPDGGRGGVPMDDGTFSFQIDVTPEAVWGADALAAATAAGVTLPGGTLGINNADVYGSPNPNPYSRTNPASSLVDSARDSGAITVTQPAGPGTPIQVSVVGADTTADTIPYKTNYPVGDLPMDGAYPERGYVFTQRVFVEVPLTELFRLPDVSGVDLNPNDPAVLSALINVAVDEASLAYRPISGDGTNVYTDGGEASNDYREMVARIQSVQNVSNQWISPAGEPTATAANVYSPGYPAWLGPTGPAGRDNGDGVAVLGQEVISSIHMSGDNFIGTSTLICQSFDNTLVNIAPGTYAPAGTAMQTIGSAKYTAAAVPAGAIPYSDGTVWIEGGMYNWNSPTQYASTSNYLGMVDRYGDFQVAYGVGTNADPSCSGVTWYEDYASVPDPTQITHVRIFIQNDGATNAMFQRTDIAIPFTVVGGTPGDLIPTWTSYTQVPGQPLTYSEMVAQFPDYQVVSGFDPALNNDDNGTAESRRGDRLTLVGAAARISKAVEASGSYSANMNWIPASQLWQTTSGAPVPIYAPGQVGSYRLTPTLTANPAPAAPVDVLVEDCLPAELALMTDDPRLTLPTYSAPWENVGTLPVTPSIQCGAGEYYMAWQFDDVAMTSTTTALPVVTIPFQVIATAPPVDDLLNEAVISSPVDFSSIEQRTDRAILDIQAPSGLRLSKVGLPALVTVDPNGWSSSPTITWRVVLSALSNTTAVSDFEVIDLLPVDGLLGSSFTGTGDFVSASLANTGAVEASEPVIYYTASAVPTRDADVAEWTDPTSALNGPDGANVWCTAVGGTVVSGAGTDADCPATPADVTGLRIVRPGTFGTDETLTLTLTTDATGNLGGATDGVVGDTMENTVRGTATGLGVPVTADYTVAFATQAYQFNTGVISGNAWDDVDADGVWDEGEPVLPGVVVVLTAVDPATGEVLTNPNTGEPLYDPAAPPTTTVAADGTYQFTGLFADIPYTVTFVTPEGYAPTTPGIDSVAPATTVTLTTPDTQYTSGVDAGYVKPATLAVAKTVVDASTGEPVTAAAPGQQLTYTVTVTNTSPDRAFTAERPAAIVDSLAGVLDDGTLVGAVTASAGAVSVVGSTVMWAGPLAPGAEATIAYTVEVTGDGDDMATNVALGVPAGPLDPDTGLPPAEQGVPIDPATGEPAIPTDPDTGDLLTPAPDQCVAPTCASTTTPLVVMPEVSKSVTIDGVAATLANVGDELTYTLNITNTSGAAYTDAHPAVVVDDLSDVLEVAVPAPGTPGASSGSAAWAGKFIVWTGPLAPGETVDVTYRLRVTTTGDLDAVNVAFSTYGGPLDPGTGLPLDPGTGAPVVTPAPEDCPEPYCATTVTPIRPAPDLSITKTDTVTRNGAVVPADTVTAGETVTYTVTIHNNSATESYDAAYPATFVDDLTAVLDDGDLVGTPSASAGSVSVVGDRLVWSGPLAAGETVTVTYQVAMTSAGDKEVRNVAFVTPPGPVDPATGLPLDPLTLQPLPTPAVCAAPVCASTDATVTVPPTPTPIPTPSPTPNSLPNTGADVTGLAAGAGLLLAAGLVALVARRRRLA